MRGSLAGVPAVFDSHPTGLSVEGPGEVLALKVVTTPSLHWSLRIPDVLVAHRDQL